ncbi:MAG: hypothetical protein WBI87_05390 [Bacteroidales bacterium]|jgi:hypothetical protein
MKEPIELIDNLKHYPLGEAKLEKIDDKLIVSNLTDSGIDGIAINTEGINEWELTFNAFEIGKNNTFNLSHFATDKNNRLKIIAQQSIYYDENTNKISFAFNSKLLSDKVLLVAKNKGEIIFIGEYLTPRDDIKCAPWWPIVAAAAVYILERVDYRREKTTDSEGNTTTTTIISWEPQKSTTFQTGKDIEFEADELLLYSKLYYPKGSEDNIDEIKEIQITARNYKKIEILSEKGC